MPESLLNIWNKTCDRLERYTHMDMRYLLRGGGWAIIAQGVESISILALSMIISRYVAKDAYGTYKFILSLAATLSALSLNDLASAVFQSTARGYDGALPAGVRASIKWSGGIFLGAFALATYYFAHGNVLIGFGILIAGCGSPLTSSVGLYRSYLAGKQDFMRQAWYGGIFAGAVSAGALAITAVFVPTPIALVIVYIISNLGATIYAYSQVFAYYKPNSSKIDPDMMRYAKHMSIIGILGTIAGNVDQILLYHFGGTVNLAIYNFSIGVLDQVKGPLKTLDSMLQARFATRTNLSIDAGIANKMKWLGLLSITSIIVYIPLAPHIYAILFPTYTESILLSQVYALSLLSLVFTPAISYLAAKKRVRALYTLSLTGNALQIAAMAIGVIGWGLWGLVISRVVVRILGAFIGFILYRLDTKI